MDTRSKLALHCCGTAFAVMLWAAGVAGVPAIARAAEPCEQNQICGLKNAEDLIRLDGSHWAIASRLAKDPATPGGFSLVDLQAHATRVLTPDVSDQVDPAYSACPGAPEAAELVTHGLDIRPHSGNTGELFAVNHGGRQSIEVFTVHVTDQGVTLTWKGCVALPSDTSANAVAALPDGIAVSSFGGQGEAGMKELLAGKPAGFVSRWTAKTGWVHLPGSEFGGDNGLVAAPDGSALYVNDWSDGTLHILPLRPGVSGGTVKLGDFHPDNVHWLEDGKLLIAGSIGQARDILACASEQACPIASRISVVDPAARKVVRTWAVPSTSSFGAASTALRDGADYWVSSFRGDRIVRLGPAPAG
ncbi:MAG TPA: hypothetical protein VGL55_13450 [Steroidobacteraceae bacterium]|jgi:hypothetical protein